LGISTALFLIAVYLTFGGPIGSEFLPHLDEGSIWVRGTLPPSEGPTASIDFTNKARVVMASFPEVTQVVSQTGRPDDGTDTAGFFNTEYFVDLKPKKQWRPSFTKQGSADRRHGQGALKVSRRHLELLAAHLRQHGRGRLRRQGRTGRQALRRRSAHPGTDG
jgi:Cu/Ag efflux pump CusA